MLSRILRVGLLLAVLGQIAWSFRPATTRAQTDQLREGQHLYEAAAPPATAWTPRARRTVRRWTPWAPRRSTSC